MSIGIWQILIIAVVVVLLFGRGKVSELMGDLGKGITNFRKGIAEGNEEMKKTTAANPEENQKAEAPTLDNETGEPVDQDKKS